MASLLIVLAQDLMSSSKDFGRSNIFYFHVSLSDTGNWMSKSAVLADVSLLGGRLDPIIAVRLIDGDTLR